MRRGRGGMVCAVRAECRHDHAASAQRMRRRRGAGAATSMDRLNTIHKVVKFSGLLPGNLLIP